MRTRKAERERERERDRERHARRCKMATLSLAALALCTPGLASLAPPRPVLARPHTGRTQVGMLSLQTGSHPKPPPGSPQAIDPRQAIWLQQNGYVWDGKAWGRGDAAAARAGRAFLRSGKRFARFVDVTDKPASPPSALAAAKKLEELLVSARAEALESSSPSLADELSAALARSAASPAFPLAWLGLQLCVVCSLGFGLPIDWAEQARLAASPETLLLSFSAGVVVAASRSLARAQLPPGVEESTGMAERLLADALDGGHALPAPAHVRFGPDSRFNLLGLTKWRMMAIGLEGLAAVSATLLMHALLQHALVGAMSPDATCSDVFAHAEVLGRNGALGATAAAAAAAVFASLPAAIRALSNEAAYQGDGLAAELDAARRARTRATAIFSAQPPAEGSVVTAADSLRTLADAWLVKFGGSPDKTATAAQFERAILGLGASLACAAAFQISGGALVAPLVARVVGAFDTYALRSFFFC